jgi:hypothetical protein
MRLPAAVLRPALLVAAAGAMVWAVIVQSTGGIAVETSWGVISSRNASRPLIAGVALAAWYAALWRRHASTDLRALGALVRPSIVSGIAVATALVVGFGWGSRIAAGPDPSGYVSQAAMFARGELTVEAPAWAQHGAWDDAAYSASPVGWHPTPQTHILAPTYSPGLPLIMAGVERVAGGGAVFYVVPLLGGVLVWSAYLLGLRLGYPWAGAVAAVLVVSSPTFIAMQLQVMSDVPVAAFWTVSLAGALGGRTALSGIAAAAAILTRPNLVPLVLVPSILIAARDRRLTRLALFAAPIAVAAAAVGALNWKYNGSPLLSGYGPLSRLYRAENVWPNLLQYGRWFVEVHTPLPLLGLAAPVLVHSHRSRMAVVAIAVPAALLALYAPFLVFHAWEWTYTRFLLPAYAPLFAGVGVFLTRLVAGSGRRRIAIAASVAIVAAIAARGWTIAVNTGTFTQRSGDDRYARAVEYARTLPARSVLVSNAHSGTLRHYTGVDVLRFEAIRPRDLDAAIAHLHGEGYSLVLIGDEFEIVHFRNLFAGTRTVAAMAKEPRADLHGVVVYDLQP